MNNHASNLPFFRYWLSILVGISLAVFGGLHFFQVSAKTKTLEISTAQNLAVGKLVYVYAQLTRIGPFPHLRTVNADGTGNTSIGDSLPALSPTWSPDGSKIAYVKGGSILGISNADGTDQVSVTSGTALRNPSWSVTNKIAYERDGQIWVFNPASASNVQFSAITQPSPQSPAWSPYGTILAFVSNGVIWTINIDGTNLRQITTGAEPSWSPNGTKLVFTKTGSGISVINIDGTGETALTNVASDNAPDWSPDGTTIAFRRGANYVTSNESGIYLMSSTGANPVRILIEIPSEIGFTHGEPDWQPLAAPRRTQFDFNGDGRSDISVFRPDSGVWYQLYSGGGTSAAQWGLATDTLTPADYDGDGKTDYAVRRASESTFYILNSFNNTVRIEPFGQPEDIVVNGDWDGDGKTDLAIYRGGFYRAFYYRGSFNNSTNTTTLVAWGIADDIPVVGDYDGDGKADAAVYRNGDWYVRRSSNGQMLSVNFGLPGDKTVPADYDGDGKLDFAVYREGIWYLLRSTQGFAAFQFGIASDIPVPADYDGDGKADAAIYRNGIWWILNSQTGAANAVSFGLSNDKPIPAAFLR